MMETVHQLAKLLLTLLLGTLLPVVPTEESQAAEYAYAVDPYQEYTYQQMCTDLAELEQMYPTLITTATLGYSVEGAELIAFSFGRGSREIILCGSMHGNEYISTAFIMYMVDRYAYGYVNDTSLNGMSYRDALDKIKFIVVPMVNPDGVSIAQTTHPGWKANSNGVDLNRNYPYYWSPNKKVPAAAAEEYRGPYASSEPETQVMLELLANTPFEMLASFHTAGEVIYWMDNRTTNMQKQFQPTATRFCRALKYDDMGVENITAFGGYMCNYARATYKKFAMTVELCPWTSAPSYPASDFDRAAKNVYQLGLLMADEVLHMKADTPNVAVLVNDRSVFFPDQHPIIIDGRTLVPLRAVLEQCGATVSWDSAEQCALVQQGNIDISLAIGDEYMLVNGEPVQLDVPAALIGDRTMLPIRAVLEALGATVTWYGDTRTVSINSTL